SGPGTNLRVTLHVVSRTSCYNRFDSIRKRRKIGCTFLFRDDEREKPVHPLSQARLVLGDPNSHRAAHRDIAAQSNENFTVAANLSEDQTKVTIEFSVGAPIAIGSIIHYKDRSALQHFYPLVSESTVRLEQRFLERVHLSPRALHVQLSEIRFYPDQRASQRSRPRSLNRNVLGPRRRVNGYVSAWV